MRFRDFLTAIILLLFAFLVYGMIAGGWIGPRGDLVIAAGPEGGAYDVVARALSVQLERQEEDRLKPVFMSTSGSGENLTLLRERKAQFALLQSAPPDRSDDINLIAPLYSEMLHILVRREDTAEIQDLSDLNTKRVAVGEIGSGTVEMMQLLMEHFAVDAEIITMGTEEGIQQLLDGKTDAVCFLAALHAPIFDDAFASGRISLIAPASRSRLVGLCSRTPHLGVSTILPASYQGDQEALPELKIPTIGLESILVCHRDVRDSTVRAVADALFRVRPRMAASIPGLAQVGEPDSSRWLPYPLHRGADSYYRRGEPGFLERYADVIALLFYSAFLPWRVLEPCAT